MEDNYKFAALMHRIAASSSAVPDGTGSRTPRNDGGGANNRHCEGALRPRQSSAFSLIELLISLIVISLIISAFIPILSNRLKHREVALGGVNNVETKCSEKFNEKCMMCTDAKCVLCINSFSCPYGQYCDEENDCKCEGCGSIFPNCLKCTKNYCEICENGYKLVDGRCELVKCAVGQYKSGITCLSCTGETYQPNNNSTASSCLSCGPTEKANANHSGCTTVTCQAGQYRNGRACINCTSPCSTCTSASVCTGCETGYDLNGTTCKESKTSAPCYQTLKTCIATFNAGDANGLPIPDGLVTMKTTASATSGSNHNEPYCWRGYTGGGCSSIDSYSTCYRTLCTWSAAKKICEYHGWRLPTDNELASFNSYGLQLCGYKGGEYGQPTCNHIQSCPGSSNGYCYSYYVWGSQQHYYYLHTGNWKGPEYYYGLASPGSVRCVRDL